MSYLVLARKYRPRNFSELVGQGHVVQALSNALESGRLHHAYLFTGTRGVGKTTVSRILAKSLNCQGPDGKGGVTATPCGVCQACADIDSGRFVDYTELDAASNRGVDEVQALLEQAVYKPVQGRFKVFMIDEVHMLSNTAFNAMLKTLEEPPEYLKFVLATTDPQKVPVTVLSRCLQFNLRPMAPETIREHLQRVLTAEQVSADTQSLKLLARAARGSMRDALSLTDQAIAYGSGALQETTVRQMLGSADRSHVFQLIDALAAADGKSVVETAEALRLHGLSAAATLEEMSAVLQRMAVLQAVPDMAAEDDTDPEQAELVRLAALLPVDETQLLYSICLHGREELGLAPDEYAGLTMVLLRLLAFKPTANGVARATTQPRAGASAEKKTLKTGAAESTKTAAAAAVQAPAATSPPVLTPTPVVLQAAGLPLPRVCVDVPQSPSEENQVNQLEAQLKQAQVAPTIEAIQVVEQRASLRDLAPDSVPNGVLSSPDGDFWHATVQALIASEAVSAMARELALQSQLVARDADQWLLRVERESLNQDSSRERLRQALVLAGFDVVLAVEIGRVTDSPARRNAALAAQAQLTAEKIVFNDALVQTLMREFAAKIVPGSIQAL